MIYSDRASELFTIRTQHQALTLGTKRASAVGAATLERETLSAEKEQHYQHLPSLAAIHNLISTAVSDTNAAQPITHRICRCHALVVIRLPSVPLRQKLLAVALCALLAPQSPNEPQSPLLARVAPTSCHCAPLCPDPALPPLEFALQRRNRRHRALQRGEVLVIVMPRHRRRFVADD